MTQEQQEIFDEIAGKLEYEAGLCRKQAESEARRMMAKALEQKPDK
jgi:hypothetical protein